MTWAKMLDRVYMQAGDALRTKFRPETIELFVLDGLKDFARETECCRYTMDDIVTTVAGEWKQEYDLPGNDSRGSTFLRAIDVWLDGDRIKPINYSWVVSPTGANRPVFGTDLHGERTFGTSQYDGDGTDALGNQYYYIRKHRFLGFYPTVEEAVAFRLDFVWCPDEGWFTNFKSGETELADRFPAIWHDAPIVYALAELMDMVGDTKREMKFRARYAQLVDNCLRSVRMSSPISDTTRAYNY